MKEQFSSASSDDAAAHLNNFVELCEMKKYKDVDGDIIKLKLFPFSIRGRAKNWLLSLSWFHQQICHRGRCMAICGRG
jgi:hypothetical protein